MCHSSVEAFTALRADVLILHMEYDYLFKVLLLGNSGVGKTSLLRRFVDGAFDGRYVTTVGVDFREKRVTYDGKHRVQLQLWDTAGQERYRSLTTAFFRDAVGFVVVFDVTDAQSFVDVANWTSQIETHADDGDGDVTVILAGNKCDLEESRVVHRPASVSGADLDYFDTSALSGVGLENVMNALVEKIMRRIENAAENDYVPKKLRPTRSAFYADERIRVPNFDYADDDAFDEEVKERRRSRRETKKDCFC